eukprot:3293450-Ditylum_brightwellii.AAC.2
MAACSAFGTRHCEKQGIAVYMWHHVTCSVPDVGFGYWEAIVLIAINICGIGWGIVKFRSIL